MENIEIRCHGRRLLDVLGGVVFAIADDEFSRVLPASLRIARTPASNAVSREEKWKNKRKAKAKKKKRKKKRLSSSVEGSEQGTPRDAATSKFRQVCSKESNKLLHNPTRPPLKKEQLRPPCEVGLVWRQSGLEREREREEREERERDLNLERRRDRPKTVGELRKEGLDKAKKPGS